MLLIYTALKFNVKLLTDAVAPATMGPTTGAAAGTSVCGAGVCNSLIRYTVYSHWLKNHSISNTIKPK